MPTRQRPYPAYMIAVAAAFLMGATQAAAPQSDRGGSCFIKADNRLAPYHVFQIARIPASTSLDAPDSASSPAFPGTDFLSGAATVRNPDPRYKPYLLNWINRCQYIKGLTRSDSECRLKRRVNGDALTTTKGNSYAGEQVETNLADQVRSAFSSYAAADGCSIAQEMQALGLNDAATEARAAQGGVRLFRGVDRSTAAMRPLGRDVELADGTRWNYLVNMCVLPAKGAALSFAGFGLDYEVNDNRTPQETSAFLAEYARLAHAAGKGVFLAINPLPRTASGIDTSNLRSIIATFDYVAFALSNGASPGNLAVGNKNRDASGNILASYERQLAIVASSGSAPLTPMLKRHIIWQVPLYQVPLAEAATFHAIVKREGYGGVSLFRNYVQQGGSCSRDANQLTACIALGQCSGQFGIGRP